MTNSLELESSRKSSRPNQVGLVEGNTREPLASGEFGDESTPTRTRVEDGDRSSVLVPRQDAPSGNGASRTIREVNAKATATPSAIRRRSGRISDNPAPQARPVLPDHQGSKAGTADSAPRDNVEVAVGLGAGFNQPSGPMSTRANGTNGACSGVSTEDALEMREVEAVVVL